jgi:GDPmannose 4,6-dehydratase
MKKKAFITGIAGQDGSYLSEHLLDEGYDVHGIVRRNSTPEHQHTRIDHLDGKVNITYGDLLDISSIQKAMMAIMPDEIYNLAAQSHVRISFDQPQFTCQVNALGVLNMLECYRQICPAARFYQASSSEMFGNSVDDDNYQRESTPMTPVSPYGCAKLYAYNIVRSYRKAYKLFASNGILFNHESPRRGANFVTNKVVKAAVRIKLGLQDVLTLGNLDAYRDWGHSYDYVRAMKKILELDKPNDIVIATGITHSIRELCDQVFSKLGLDYTQYIEQDPRYMRPDELKYLKGDCSKAKTLFDWDKKYTFETMMNEMTTHWLEVYKKEVK